MINIRVFLSNNIGDGGAKSICEMLTVNHTLAKLNLSCNDNGCSVYFVDNERLEDNLIGDEGATCISKALMVNSTLTVLDLYCDKIESTDRNRI